MKKKKKKFRLKKKYRNRLIMLLGGALILGLIITNIVFLIKPLQLKSEHIILNVNQEYDYKDNISFVYFGNKDEVTVDKKIETNEMKEYSVVYSYKNKNVECLVTVTDTEAPVLTLKDYTTDLVEEVTADKFVESCEDLSEVTFSIETKNLSDKGKTTVTIKATDAYGNETTEKCKLIRKKDKNGPTITAEDSIEVLQGESLDLNSVKVEDDVDPNPTITLQGDVDFSVPGEYKVTYEAQDRSGNVTTKDVTIIVKENEEEKMRVVYLTFDDGPSYNTPKVLEILEKYNVKATFFVTGTGQDKNQYIVDAYNAGHTIGLHTYTHDYASVYASVDAYYNDLNSVGQMVKDLIGFVPNVIRFPGGSSNTVSANYCSGIMSQLSESVIANGYQYYDWNVSSGDASGTNVAVETIISGATSGTEDKIMILFHDASGKDTTVEALPTIIEHYKSQGYVFMPITKETSYVCHHGVNN